MNAKKAKTLRKKIYGEDYSPRAREYAIGRDGSLRNTGKRKQYQDAKGRFYEKEKKFLH